MKKYLIILFLSLVSTPIDASTDIVGSIERKYWGSWVVFIVDDDALYVAKKVRKREPYFFAFIPTSGAILKTNVAQDFWDQLNQLYSLRSENITEAPALAHGGN